MNDSWRFEPCAPETDDQKPVKNQNGIEYTHGAVGTRPGHWVHGYGFSQPAADADCERAARVVDAYEVIQRVGVAAAV